MSNTKHCEDKGHVVAHESLGKEVKYNDLDIYINEDGHGKVGVILVTDIFGWEFPNARKIADRFAAAGFVVAMPNVLRGNYFDAEKHTDLMAYIAQHPDERVCGDIDTTIQLLKSLGCEKIGAFGFCWGGKYTTQYAADPSKIQAAAALHGSFLKIETVKEHKVPVLYVFAGNDEYYPKEFVQELQQTIKSTPPHDFKEYAGVGHGFAVRGDLNDPTTAKAQDAALEETINWFKKHLQ
eukprot:jgi/Chlat1/8025/Chrsp7S07763